ncbi:MAG: hypothetical protein HYX95_01745 [Chloroflexi bacterium]|nr:hypothetical protein [Chloroflexota bacterium]
MNREDILAMTPGADMNIKVAEQVMGHLVTEDETFGWMERMVDPEDGSSVWDLPQPYSEDMSAAELVIDRMTELGHEDAVCWVDFGKGAYTEPEAVCKAALCALWEIQRQLDIADNLLSQALGDEAAGK